MRKAVDKYYDLRKRKKVEPTSFSIKKKPVSYCLHCAKEIPFGGKKTCSLVCRKKRDYQSRKASKQRRILSQEQRISLFRDCVECGKQFEKYKTKLTCSLPCWEANRDKRALISRQARLGFKYFSCKSCSKEFKRNGNQKTCSAKCKKEQKAKRWKKWYKDKATCRYCHKVFKKKSNDALCSLECKKNYRKEKLAKNWQQSQKKFLKKLKSYVNCKTCNKQFDKGHNKTTCSDECRIELRRKRDSAKWYKWKKTRPEGEARKKWTPKRKINCFRCGNFFLRVSSSAKYCSLVCKNDFNKEKNKHWKTSASKLQTHTHTHTK